MAVGLNVLLNSLLKTDNDWRLRLVKEWPVIIGDLHSKMRLEKVVDDTIVIGVYDSHWMQELFMLSRTILRTINIKLGNEEVKQIRFTLATAQKKSLKPKKITETRESLNVLRLSQQQSAALGTIKDLDLQQSLQKILQRCKS